MTEYKNYNLRQDSQFGNFTIHNKKGGISNMLKGTYTSAHQAMLAIDRLSEEQVQKVLNKRPKLKTKTVKTGA